MSRAPALWVLGGGAMLLLLAAAGSTSAQAAPRPALPPLSRSPSPPPHPPLPGALHIRSRFGWREDPITHERAFHSGIDLPAPTGTAVYAPHAGQVARIDQDGIGKGEVNGNAVHLRIGAQRWAFLHLSAVLVRPGEAVARGQVVGHVGSTGRATGPHLHLQVYDADERLLDPERLFPAGTFRGRA